MKKAIALVLSALLVISLAVSASAYEERLDYLLLGDSIAEGFGIDNPYDASYGRIVADTNGWYYSNYARVATDSSELLEKLTDESDWYGMRYAVRNADVISLSIGANDYFDNDDVYTLAVGAFFGLNNKKLDKIADDFYVNLSAIIDTIYEINPDVVLLVQNVYTKVWYGIAAHLYSACVSRVNAQIERYDAENPGKIYLCDISPAMNGKPENLADDCVHPNAAGNVAIARVVLQQLYEIGVGTQTEPVINTEGVDYNFFNRFYDNKCAAGFLNFIVKLATGNAVNIKRS